MTAAGFTGSLKITLSLQPPASVSILQRTQFDFQSMPPSNAASNKPLSKRQRRMLQDMGIDVFTTRQVALPEWRDENPTMNESGNEPMSVASEVSPLAAAQTVLVTAADTAADTASDSEKQESRHGRLLSHPLIALCASTSTWSPHPPWCTWAKSRYLHKS